MAFTTKTTLFAQLAAKAAARNITKEDLQALFECTECGAALRLPTDGATPASTPAVGTSWAAFALFSVAAASATPANGGYGLIPGGNGTLDGTLTVEANADGWYEIEYDMSVTPSELTEFAVVRTRGAQNQIRCERRVAAGELGNPSGKDFIQLKAGDVVQMVARSLSGSAGTTQVWSASLTVERRLAA